jgi:hypothetical protein
MRNRRIPGPHDIAQKKIFADACFNLRKMLLVRMGIRIAGARVKNSLVREIVFGILVAKEHHLHIRLARGGTAHAASI